MHIRILLCFLLFARTIHADSKPSLDEEKPNHYFFYQPHLNIGSETQFNPLTVIINTGFDILRSPSYQSDPFKIKWRRASKNVFTNMVNPISAIKDSGGLHSFVNHEVFPLEPIGEDGGQFFANYALHFVGEGMTSRKLGEWFDHQGFRYPKAWGIASMLTAQILNEVVENGDFDGPNWDPVSDVLLFDALGHILFTFDPVAKFFSTTLQVNYWGFQPVLDIRTRRLLNLGENIAFKLNLPWTDWRFFTLAGDGAILGLEMPVNSTHHISCGLGQSLVGITADFNDKGARIQRRDGDFNSTLGVFWDISESLVASLRIAGTKNNKVELNLYPGLFKFLGMNPSRLGIGAYLIAGHLDGLAAGLTFQHGPIVPGFSMIKPDSRYEEF